MTQLHACMGRAVGGMSQNDSAYISGSVFYVSDTVPSVFRYQFTCFFINNPNFMDKGPRQRQVR